MTRLFIPRVLPVVLLGAGLSFATVATLGLIRRLAQITAGEILAEAAIGGIASTVGGLLLGVLMLYSGLRWITYSVAITPDRLRARILWRSWDLPLADVKGVVLKQANTTPQLRIVPRSGEVIVLPGWSLRVKHPDGEVEDAGPALERMGPELGIKVKLITLLNQPIGAERPRRHG